MSKSVFWRDVAFPSGIVDLTTIGNEGLILPAGTTPERPSAAANGTIRFNTTSGFTEVFQNGAWNTLTTTGISGEANTASNTGAGQGIFRDKSSFDLRFKSIVAGSNISVGSNANEIIINATAVGEANTATNVGLGNGQVFDSKIGTALQFRTLRSLSPALSIATSGNNIDFTITGGVGEVNTGSNNGAGAQVFRDKIGVDFRHRTLLGTSTEIDVAQGTETISIGLANNPVMPGTGSMTLPRGNTVAQPAPVNGMLRYDTDTNELKGVVNGAWQTITTAVGTFLPLGGGTLTGNLTLDSGVNFTSSTTSQVILSGPVIMQAGANIDMTAGGSVLMQAGATVDGRDLSADGIVTDGINLTGVTGMIARISDPNVFAHRNITGVTSQIVVANGDGSAGDPTIGFATNPVFAGTESMTIPSGTTVQQPVAPTDGMIRVNTQTNAFEFYSGAAWISPLTATADVDFNLNDIVNVGLVDSRDLTADGLIIDAISGVADDSGVYVKTGGTYTTQTISADASVANLGAVVTNGDGSGAITVGVDITNQAAITIDGLDELLIHDVSAATNGKTTINDIVALVSSSGLDTEIDVATEFGFLARVADGVVGDFERRTLEADITANLAGIVITDGDGVAGNPTIGIDYTDTPFIGTVDDAYVLPLYDGVGDQNINSSIQAIRELIHASALRVSESTLPVIAGTSIVPFTIGVGDFDMDSTFSDPSDSYTPTAGVYEIKIYAEVDAGTAAGDYNFRVLVDGVDTGACVAYISADGTTSNSVQVSDQFLSDGTQAFTVQVVNNSGGAATLARVRMSSQRMY